MSAAAPVLLKLSGEALGGDAGATFDPTLVARIAGELAAAAAAGTPLAVVVGGGNIVRGRELQELVTTPSAGDRMGMLATLINAVALREGLRAQGCAARIYAPQAHLDLAAVFDRDAVLADLAARRVVIFGGGTGHPFFTTDTTAALRAAEIDARCLLKGSGVDGIYTADPRTDPGAERIARLSFDQALAGRYAVMDATAFALCRERRIPIRVFDMTAPGAITAALGDDPPGTLVAD